MLQRHLHLPAASLAVSMIWHHSLKLCAAVVCCSSEGSLLETIPIVPTTTCSPAYAVMGIFAPIQALGGGLVDNSDAWRSLHTLHYLIAAGVPG